MEEPLPESNIADQNIPPKDNSSPNQAFFKIASVILIILIIYFSYLIYNKL